MNDQRKCLTCSKAIAGRADKKYCSDYCRATNRNAQKKQVPALVHFVDQKLKHNRQVLSELNPTGKARVDKEELIRKGFHAGYFTNVYQTRKGHTYFFCYDYGYRILSEQEVLIVQLQPYVQQQFDNSVLEEEIAYIT